MKPIKDLTLQEVREILESESKRSENFTENLKFLRDEVLGNATCHLDGLMSFLETLKRMDELRVKDGLVPVMHIDSNDGWIPCKVKMPPEHDSIFKKLKGTRAWKAPMFEKESNYVIATVEYEDGEREVKTMYTTDGQWKTGEVKCKVIAWRPLPEPYREK